MKGLIAALIALAAIPPADAAGRTAAPPTAFAGVIAVTAVDAVAEVVAADLELRTVTIKDPSGRNVMIVIPPELPLDPIAKGVLLDLRYVEAEALTIGKPGVPYDAEVLSVAIAPLAGRHGPLTAKPKRVKGRVLGIDRRKRELTVAAPDDTAIALNVSNDVAGFSDLKVGDAAVIEYTDAVALSVVKHAAGAVPAMRF